MAFHAIHLLYHEFDDHHAYQIAHATLRKLLEVKGISEQKAQKIKEIIKTTEIVKIGFQTATTRLSAMKDMIFISTGAYNFNLILSEISLLLLIDPFFCRTIL